MFYLLNDLNIICLVLSNCVTRVIEQSLTLLFVKLLILIQMMLYFVGKRLDIYVVHLDDIEIKNEACLVAYNACDSWLWHRRLGHVSMNTISKLVKKYLVIGLPKLRFNSDKNL
ncbi:hypothetical protein REPUB_Repub06bG0158400 [Reevesia pubescens]